MITRTQLSLQRTALINRQCEITWPLTLALQNGDVEIYDELALEWHRLGVTIQVLSNWLLEIDGQEAVKEVDRILAHSGFFGELSE